jgi:CP family cyanate transporter-like MFS transporter
MLVTWLATISMSTGRSALLAGFDVMFYQLFALAGSILLPLALRGRAERFIPASLPLIGLTGTLGLMLAPGGILLWSALLGLFAGSSLGMSLTLMAHRARDHDASAALSGMSQSVGYIVAAIGPVAFGALHAFYGGWIAPLSLLLLVMTGLIIVGLLVGRDRYVLESRRTRTSPPPRQSA